MDGQDDFSQRYKAFISYSHADNRERGRKWAEWLHRSLETYRIPAELIGKANRYGAAVPERIYPVFLDEKELSANADLSASLNSALERSDFLIVISSPKSAASPYVQEEIRHFKRIGRARQIIALIVSGEPEYGSVQSERQCFPEVLRFAVDAQGRILPERRPAQQLRCYLPLDNPHLLQYVAGHRPEYEAYGIDIRFFNPEKMLARRFFYRLPQQLGADMGRTHLHFLLFGFGNAAQALLLQGLRVFHRLPGQYSRWTVFTADADALARRFFDRYPQIRRIAPVDICENDGRLHHILAAQLAALPPDGQLIVLCAAQDPRDNLNTAVEIIRAGGGADFPVHVYGGSPHIGTLLGDELRRRLHFFGAEEDICTHELITATAQDRLTQAIHADYLRQSGALGQEVSSESAAYQTQWQQLGEDAKDANRAQADHILYKLILNGQDPAAPPVFDAAQIEQLAAAEHHRWAAHRYLNGWTYAPVRDDAAKTHPSLIEWEALSDSEKQKDRDTVIRIAALLQDNPLV